MATITITKNVKRISIKRKKCPNPLFVKWIQEWITEAVAKDAKVRFGYRKALHSLQNYPLLLHSGRECAILQDFGPKLCARLDQRLAAHNTRSAKIPVQNTSRPKHSHSSPNKKPAASSGKPPSIPLPLPTAAKRLGADPKTPPKKTRKVVDPPPDEDPKKTRKVVDPQPVEDPKTPPKKTRKVVDPPPDKDLLLPPGSFDIILVVDNAEVFGNTKAAESATRQELTALGVHFDVRSLKVGDYAWVARDRSCGGELVLPYLVERKRVDDLACSIKDGRYREQKFRLKQCGVANLIYLIESAGKGDLHAGLPLKTLQQASVNTEIHGGFIVKHVASHHMAMQYLAAMTAVISRCYQNKVLVRCQKDSLSPSNINDDLVALMSFNEFNKAASKTRKWLVHEMWIKHLIQLRGVSVEKAVAIAQLFPSPRSLLAAYSQTDSGAALLAKIAFGEPGRTVGPAVSAAVHRLYTTHRFI